jgi:hypothetical protein
LGGFEPERKFGYFNGFFIEVNSVNIILEDIFDIVVGSH